MSVGDDEAELQLTQVTTAVGLPDTAAAAGAAAEEEVHLPPPDAVDEDQALPTEVTEDLVSTVALGAVEDVPEPADDATEVTDNLDASVSDLAKTWRAKRDLNDGSQSAVAMPSADCLSAELSRWVYGPSGFFKRTPGKRPTGFPGAGELPLSVGVCACLQVWHPSRHVSTTCSVCGS